MGRRDELDRLGGLDRPETPAPLAEGGWGAVAARDWPYPVPPTRSRKVRGGLVLAVGALIGLVHAQVHAQPAPSWKQMTSKQLATACHAPDPAQRAACVGYVSGVYDLQFAPTPPRGVCPPADFTPDLLAQVVTAYADTHEDGPAPAAIGQAIVRFFPCPEPRR